MRQTTEDAVAALSDSSRPEILQTKIQPAGERWMDGGDVRPTFLSACQDCDFGLRMAEQNLDELHRLSAEEIYLRIAGPWARSEQN